MYYVYNRKYLHYVQSKAWLIELYWLTGTICRLCASLAMVMLPLMSIGPLGFRSSALSCSQSTYSTTRSWNTPKWILCQFLSNTWNTQNLQHYWKCLHVDNRFSSCFLTDGTCVVYFPQKVFNYIKENWGAEKDRTFALWCQTITLIWHTV